MSNVRGHRGHERGIKGSNNARSLSAAWEEVVSLKAKNKHLEELVEGVLKENCQLKKVVETLKDREVKQEDYSRRQNLRIINVPEEAGEDNKECVKKVKDILSELGVPPEIKCPPIHRAETKNSCK